MATFEQGIDKFQFDLSQISAHDLTDHELWCKNEEIKNGEAVYCELTTTQGVLFATYSQILTLKEIISEQLKVTGRHLRRTLRDTERREYELAEGTKTRSLAFVEVNAKASKAMVDQVPRPLSKATGLVCLICSLPFLMDSWFLLKC